MTPQQVAKVRKPKRLTGNYYAGGKQGAFIDEVMPHALRFAERTGLDPRLAIATAALETGWGKHAPGGALFGIKGSGQDLMTTEYVDGKPVQMKQSFRRYDAEQGDYPEKKIVHLSMGVKGSLLRSLCQSISCLRSFPFPNTNSLPAISAIMPFAKSFSWRDNTPRAKTESVYTVTAIPTCARK